MFQCEHRYTGAAICATPCDGRDDLCRNNEDERDCSLSFSFANIVLIFAAAQAFIILFCAVLWRTLARRRGRSGEFNDGPFEESLEQLTPREFANILHLTTDFETWQNLSIAYFNSQLERHGGDARKAEHSLFHELRGCSDGAAVLAFLDALDQDSVSNRVKVKLSRKFAPSLAVASERLAQLKALASLVVAVSFYYSDVTKDILLCVRFQSSVLGWPILSWDTVRNKTYPFAIFAISVLSLVVTEIFNFFVVLNDDAVVGKFSDGHRLLFSFLAPILPGMTIYAEKKLELERHRIGHEHSEGLIAASLKHKDRLDGFNSKLLSLRSLRAKMRANENAVEHFAQLSLIVAVFLAEISSTRSVQTVASLFLNDNVGFVAAAFAMSIFSIVRGHLNLVDFAKKGQLPITGKIILAAYFILGAVARVFAVVLFLTPLLGLFDCLALGRTATVPASNDTVFNMVLVNSSSSTVDAETSVEPVHDGQSLRPHVQRWPYPPHSYVSRTPASAHHRAHLGIASPQEVARRQIVRSDQPHILYRLPAPDTRLARVLLHQGRRPEHKAVLDKDGGPAEVVHRALRSGEHNPLLAAGHA